MTLDELTEINGLLARFIRLTQLDPKPAEAAALAERLRLLGLEIDWTDEPKAA